MTENNHMPKDTVELLQRIQENGVIYYLVLLALSMWAGFVKYLSSLNGKKPTFLGLLTDVCTSGFVGVITALTCQYYEVDFLLTAAITGISAHNGTRSLYLIGNFIKKNTTAPKINQEEEPIAPKKVLSHKQPKE